MRRLIWPRLLTTMKASRRDRNRLVVAAFAVFGLLPIMMIFIGVQIGHDFAEEHRIRLEVRALRAHQTALRDVFIDLLQAETGQRGYLLTDRDTYLAPYLHAAKALPIHLQALAAASADALARSDAQQIDGLSRQKLAELDRTVELARHGHGEEALVIVRTDAGQQYMDQIRTLATTGRARDVTRILRLAAAIDRVEASTGVAAVKVAVAMMLTLAAAGWIVLASFRSRRKALTDALESEVRYRLVTEHATDVIVRIDPKGVFTFVSPASAAVLGYAPEELIGRSVFDLADPEDVPRLLEHYAGFVSLGSEASAIVTTGRVIRKDGRAIWIEGRPKLVYDSDGRPVAAFDVLRDVTQRREIELALEAARCEALAAAEAKSEFLANMSHELRTPLTAIIGFGGLLAEDPSLPAGARRHLQRIRDASDALLATVNDVLDFSKLEAGQVEICPWPSDLEVFVETVQGIVAEQARAKGLALEVLAELPEIRVEIDEDRVRQVLLNLLSNAIKFTDQGFVRLELAHDGARLCCRISDTGAGIPEEKLGQLFQRFSQVDGSSTRRHGGTGLGLAICKGLVEAMGGSIGVESRPGEGSTFWFDIAAPIAVEPESFAAEGGTEDEHDLTGLRVLVVDDAALNRELIAAMLKPQGCDVVTAESGEAALDLVAGAVFDVMLIDRHMPGIDGCELARRIRESDGPNASACLLACSADVLATLEAVFDGELSKPITPSRLIDVVAQGSVQRHRRAEPGLAVA